MVFREVPSTILLPSNQTIATPRFSTPYDFPPFFRMQPFPSAHSTPTRPCPPHHTGAIRNRRVFYLESVNRTGKSWRFNQMEGEKKKKNNVTSTPLVGRTLRTQPRTAVNSGRGGSRHHSRKSNVLVGINCTAITRSMNVLKPAVDDRNGPAKDLRTSYDSKRQGNRGMTTMIGWKNSYNKLPRGQSTTIQNQYDGKTSDA